MISYVKERGYVSYSSLKKIRDGEPPGYTTGIHFDVGTELHSRWLEGKTIQVFDKPTEAMLKGMTKALNNDRVAYGILYDSESVELEFNELVNGVMTHGFIDICPPVTVPYLGDLKTTKETERSNFIKSMDFLQAVLYMKANKRKDFYYIGVSKIKPYNVFTFRVSDYPDRIKAATNELTELLSYVKKASK